MTGRMLASGAFLANSPKDS